MTLHALEITEPETLRFGYGNTSLGIIVVAESVRGVAALLIGDDRDRLLSDLKDVFPGATLGHCQLNRTRLSLGGRRGA